jgi:lysine 2,3-aminomutase
MDTEEVEKKAFRVNFARWRQAFAYLASRPEVEDVVVSGGDSYNLRPEQLEAIGRTLLDIPNIRRIRFATKGLAIMPQKAITHTEWLDAVTRVVEHGRAKHKEVVIHTHFNHPAEITWISQQALGMLHERGITVRNQSVLLRGVNDSVDSMVTLVRRLGYINVHPYYVYLCDMVKGVEDLRTSLAAAERIEKGVRGVTAGFNTPTFVCDTPGGGGKRDLHSYEYYNRETGIAVYTAPSVKPGKYFLFCDPLHSLGEESQKRWADESEQQRMVDEAVAGAQTRLAS